MSEIHFDSDEGTVASQTLTKLQPLRVAPTVARDFNTIGLDIEPVACLSLKDVVFEFDSSFVTPGVQTILSRLPRLRETNKNQNGDLPKLSIFAHADPVGDDSYNRELSGRRARAVFGLLTQNVSM